MDLAFHLTIEKSPAFDTTGAAARPIDECHCPPGVKHRENCRILWPEATMPQSRTASPYLMYDIVKSYRGSRLPCEVKGDEVRSGGLITSEGS